MEAFKGDHKLLISKIEMKDNKIAILAPTKDEVKDMDEEEVYTKVYPSPEIGFRV